MPLTGTDIPGERSINLFSSPLGLIGEGPQWLFISSCIIKLFPCYNCATQGIACHFEHRPVFSGLESPSGGDALVEVTGANFLSQRVNPWVSPLLETLLQI